MFEDTAVLAVVLVCLIEVRSAAQKLERTFLRT